jgi:hypothetical protein
VATVQGITRPSEHRIDAEVTPTVEVANSM